VSAPSETPQPIAYGTFTKRIRALITDMALSAGVIVLLLILGSVSDNIPGSGRVLLFLMFAQVLLYEPIMVWQFGATVGHRAANLRVVSDSTNGNPTFLQALVRYLIKGMLGMVSFLAMFVTTRHQSFHDYLSRTTVQVRDLATADDFLLERSDAVAESEQMPPVWRRLLVIAVYEVLTFFGMGILLFLIDPNGCANGGPCGPLLQIVVRVAGLAMFALFMVVIVFGWRGKLLGARRRVVQGAAIAQSTEESTQPLRP